MKKTNSKTGAKQTQTTRGAQDKAQGAKDCGKGCGKNAKDCG